MPKYTQRFRLQMVRRMIGPNRISASTLSAEVGVPQPTLSRWLREAGTVEAMHDNEPKPNPPESAPPRRPQDWSPAEKFRIISEASGLDEQALGALLRREGLHAAQLDEWRDAALSGLKPRPRRRGRTPQQKRIRKLEAELRRKDKALAETAALLVLQGKVEALWGAEGADTRGKSAK